MQPYLKYLVLSGGIFVFSCGAEETLSEQVQVLELKNGDRITAVIISQTESSIEARTRFGTITIPLDEIEKQTAIESVSEPEPTSAEESPAEEAPAEEAATPSEVPPVEGEIVQEEQLSFAKKFFANLGGEVQLGLDAGFGASDYMNYYGRLDVTHGQDRWKNIWHGMLTYGKNKGEVSADKLDSSYRLEYDVTADKFFVYFEPTGGYDTVREIDYYYTAGAGLGYHILKKEKISLDFSTGGSYQSYHYENEPTRDDMYIDFEERFSWAIAKDLNFNQKLTFSPQVDDWSVYRATLEAGLSWGFYKNMTFNLTLIDKYDSRPSEGIDKNDMQLVSSIGLKF